MTAAPKIDGRSISVFRDELGRENIDDGEGVIVKGGVDKRGAGSEEGYVECPNIFQVRANAEKGVRTN
jgi:hypothetical protein